MIQELVNELTALANQHYLTIRERNAVLTAIRLLETMRGVEP